MKKVKYDKQRVDYNRHTLSHYDMDGLSLEDLILYLKKIHADYEKECFEKDLECNFHITQNYDDVDLYLKFSRWETDEEFQKRVDRNEKARLKAAESRKKAKEKFKKEQLQRQEMEYQNYLKLKEKYEPTS